MKLLSKSGMHLKKYIKIDVFIEGNSYLNMVGSGAQNDFRQMTSGNKAACTKSVAAHKYGASLRLIAGRLSNNAYDAAKGETIDVLTKSGHILNVAEASDLPNIQALSKRVEKFYICYPKELREE